MYDPGTCVPWNFSGGSLLRFRDSPSFGFTPLELRKLRALKTPVGIQKFLDDLRRREGADETQRRPSGKMQGHRLHGERNDEQPQARDRDEQRGSRARALDAGGDLVRCAADEADPYKPHERRERKHDTGRHFYG